MHTPQLPTSRKAYIYCSRTGEFLTVTAAPLVPYTGTYSVPPNATLVEPEDVALVPFKCACFDVESSQWHVVDDFRAVMLYAKSTAQPVANRLSLGQPLPADVTTMAPVPLDQVSYRRNVWDDGQGTWRVVPDYEGVGLWNKADASPAAPLTSGIELPGHLTVVPPSTAARPIQFDEETQRWELMPG